VYLAFLLCECCGLRRGEAVRAESPNIIVLPTRVGAQIPGQHRKKLFRAHYAALLSMPQVNIPKNLTRP